MHAVPYGHRFLRLYTCSLKRQLKDVWPRLAAVHFIGTYMLIDSGSQVQRVDEVLHIFLVSAAG